MTEYDEIALPVDAPCAQSTTIVSPALARRLAWILGGMSVFGPLAIDMYLPAFPRIAKDLDTTIGPVQITLAIFLLGLAVGQVFWGTLSDRIGRGAPLMSGCLLFTYIANSSFIFIELFGVPVALFGFLFATNSIGLYIGGQSNRWLLRRFSSEQLLHTGMGINVCAALSLVACAWTGLGGFPLLFGVVFLCLTTLGLIFPNATAIAMQPFAAEAGGASALLGIFQFILGAAGGALVGVFHNGTALPMAVQIACYGLAARGILFLAPQSSQAE